METDIVGTIVVDPMDARILLYNVDPDTLPQNTLDPVNGIINPLVTGPNAGLPGPIIGVRYLIVEDIGATGSPTTAWGDVIANANDIIEYNGTEWVVAFDSTTDIEIQYVTNLNTNIQYRFADNSWVKSTEGWYGEGDYSIVI